MINIGEKSRYILDDSQNSTNSKITTDDYIGENVAHYPKDNDIKIDPSNLELRFQKFKTAVKSEFSIELIVVWFSLMLPVLSKTEFRSIWVLSSDLVKAIYFALFLVVSLLILKSICFSLVKFFSRFLPFSVMYKIEKWLNIDVEDYESKPSGVIKLIQRQCEDKESYTKK